jgi:hypothetical protein
MEGSMGVVDDVLKAFDRIPIWKRLQNVPTEVDELRERVAALEKLVDGKAPGEPCPFCGAPAYRLDHVDMNGQREVYKCQSCEKEREVRLDLLQKRPASRASKPRGRPFGF